MKNSFLYKSGLAPESAGVFKCAMYFDDYLVLENHNGILDLKSECIKINVGKRVLAVFGENLGIFELDGCILKIKGKIFKIEYLT